MNAAARFVQAGSIALALLSPLACLAVTDSHATAFAFTHAASVDSGLISVLGTFTTPTATVAPTLNLPQFDRRLGRLTKATVTVTTSGATFAVAPSGVLSLISTASATRRLAYGIASGTASGSNANEVTTSGSVLLTLLGLGSSEIGGATLATSNAFTAESDLAQFAGSGNVAVTLTATDTLTVSTLVSLVNGAGFGGSGQYAGTATVAYDYTPWSLGGRVYNDADHDGSRGPAEGGTGLALVAKLLSGTTGAVLQTATVDPATGAYAFAAGAGSYRVIVDDNASTADTTPLVAPAGWSGTQSPGFSRNVTLTADLGSQDFGLVHATAACGRLFADTGAGAGVPNDGARNGAEPGLAGHTVRILDSAGTAIDSVVSAADGAWCVYVPPAVANASVLRIEQFADPALVVTGASAGSTGGAWSRALQGVSFAYSNAQAYSGVDFGSVQISTLTAAGTQAAVSGDVLFFRHRFVARSAGSVTFSASPAGASIVPWTQTLYVDDNDNGVIDGTDHFVNGPIALATGQAVALIVKVSIPAGAPANLRLAMALRADLLLANSAPALTTTSSVTDTSIVVQANGGSVTLIKSVTTSAVAPGGAIGYTISFTNPGPGAISNLVIADRTPAYTTFASSAAPTLPASLTNAGVVVPSVGAAGDLRWTFTGSLAPNETGSVQFTVMVAL